MKRYQVETYTVCDGWVNANKDDNDKPVLFDTYAEAQADLDSFWHDLTEDGMADTYSRDDWRVAEVAA